jgi:hypothetical protein
MTRTIRLGPALTPAAPTFRPSPLATPVPAE